MRRLMRAVRRTRNSISADGLAAGAIEIFVLTLATLAGLKCLAITLSFVVLLHSEVA
jgi:hypothetical protein